MADSDSDDIDSDGGGNDDTGTSPYRQIYRIITVLKEVIIALVRGTIGALTEADIAEMMEEM